MSGQDGLQYTWEMVKEPMNKWYELLAFIVILHYTYIFLMVFPLFNLPDFPKLWNAWNTNCQCVAFDTIFLEMNTKEGWHNGTLQYFPWFIFCLTLLRSFLVFPSFYVDTFDYNVHTSGPLMELWTWVWNLHAFIYSTYSDWAPTVFQALFQVLKIQQCTDKWPVPVGSYNIVWNSSLYFHSSWPMVGGRFMDGWVE